MTRFLPLSLLAAAGLLVVSCGSSDDNAANPNCSNNSCSACGSCYDLCVCTTGNLAQCAPACGLSSTGGTSGGGGSGGAATGGSGGTLPAGELAKGLAMSEIDIYQAVRVPLMKDWGEPPRNAPVVADREGVFRVFVTPEAGYQAREIVARVDLGGAGLFDGKAFIGGPSNEGDPNSTIQVPIPPGAIKPGQAYSVSLLEASAGSFAGTSDKAKFGAVNLAAQNAGTYTVMLVPIVVGGVTPKLGQSEIQNYRDTLFKMYPVADLKIEVRAPASYGGAAPQRNGSGWSQLLSWLMQLRSSDKPPAQTYYYGIFTPGNSFMQWCQGACVAGLSTTPQPNDVIGRTGMGLGFFAADGNPGSPETMAHELGHTLGLIHAPCGQGGAMPQNVDPAYPYSGASIGTQGWDIITKGFLDPGKYKDIMSYCDPNWTADWTFNKMFKRIAYVNGAGSMAVSKDALRAPGKFRTAIVAEGGSLAWGSAIDTPWPVLGAERPVDVLDGSGAVLGTIKGFTLPVGHDGTSEFLLLRDDGPWPAGAQAIRVSGSTETLAL